jgi:hypothetical protein
VKEEKKMNEDELDPNNPKQQFRGIWIPKEILDLEDLTAKEMMLWAIINSLSNEKNSCYASNMYFAKRLKTTEKFIQALLKSLKDKNLIKQVAFDGRKRFLQVILNKPKGCRHHQNYGPRDPENDGPCNPENRGPYNKEDNKAYKNRDSKESLMSQLTFSPEVEELTTHMISSIKRIKPDFKVPNLTSWKREMDYILRLDNRNAEEVVALINWLRTDSFWRTNVLSPKKLRDKYDMLVLKMQEAKERTNMNREYERDYDLEERIKQMLQKPK